MEVLAIGTTVYIGPDKSTEGRVTGINIGDHNYCQYEISWWVAGQRYTQWLEELEITVKPSDARFLKIGFRNVP